MTEPAQPDTEAMVDSASTWWPEYEWREVWVPCVAGYAEATFGFRRFAGAWWRSSGTV
jgi:hypothetical protein